MGGLFFILALLKVVLERLREAEEYFLPARSLAQDYLWRLKIVLQVQRGDIPKRIYSQRSSSSLRRHQA